MTLTPTVSFPGWQFPDATQELLLQAALKDPEAGHRAWDLWRRLAGGDHLEAGANRLLPLVYRNLASHWRDDRSLASLQGVYRKTWSQNQIRLRTLADLLLRFHDQGIEPMVLKGGALILLTYRDFGVRPMTDIDLLVTRDAARRSIDSLRAWRWQPSLDCPELLIDIRHGDEFAAPDGQRVDLHWSLLQECCGPQDNDDFWRRAISCDIHGTPCKALCPADQLLHVIVHGARWSQVQPCGWVADSTVLIRTAGASLDWSAFTEQVKSRRLVAPVRGAVEYLRSRMAAAIPSSALDELRQAPVPFRDRLEHRVKIRPRPLVGTLPVLVFDYLRLKDPPVSFRQYLQLTLGCHSFSELIAATTRLVAARCQAYLRLRSSGVTPPPRLRDPARQPK